MGRDLVCRSQEAFERPSSGELERSEFVPLQANQRQIDEARWEGFEPPAARSVGQRVRGNPRTSRMLPVQAPEWRSDHVSLLDGGESDGGRYQAPRCQRQESPSQPRIVTNARDDVHEGARNPGSGLASKLWSQ